MTLENADSYVVELPPYYGFDLKVSGTLTEQYSNNINFSGDKEDSVEDFQTVFDFKIDTRYTGKRRALGLSGNMRREIKYDEDDVQNPYEEVNVYFRDEITQYDDITIFNRYRHTKLPNTFEEEFGRVTGRFDKENNNFGLTYRKQLGKKLFLLPGYNYVLNRARTFGTVNTYKNSFTLNSEYTHSAITSFTGYLSYTRSTAAGINDVNSRKITLGIERYITKNFILAGRAGLDIFSVGDRTLTKELYYMSLKNEVLLDRKTRGSLNLQRDVTIVQESNELFENWRASMNISRDFQENFVGMFSSFYGTGKYLSSGARDYLLGNKFLFIYRVWEGKRGQRIQGRVGYTHSRLSSNREDRGYTRQTMDLGLLAEF